MEWAKVSRAAPPFATAARKRSGRRLAGMKYENAVQEHFATIYPGQYTPGPWLYFKGAGGTKWCQPDGLIFDLTAGTIILVEIKYQHTTDAWWQLRRLYEPVLRALFPAQLWTFHTLEVVKWYDPEVLWPEPTRLLSNPIDAAKLPDGHSGIHIWKP